MEVLLESKDILIVKSTDKCVDSEIREMIREMENIGNKLRRHYPQDNIFVFIKTPGKI